MKYNQTIRDSLPSWSAGLACNKLRLFISIIPAELVIGKDKIIGDSEVQVPVFERQFSQLMHEVLDKEVS